MDVSNKTLAMFLVAAIVVSLAGTMISLNRLDSLTGVTGYLDFDDAEVTLDIEALLSIIIVGSSLIDFGACDIHPSNNVTINSETVDGNGGACDVMSPGGITVRNDGNVNANVTMQLNNTGYAQGGTFLFSPANSWSSIAYRTVDIDGCSGTLVGGYTTVANTNNLTACNTLEYGASNDRFIWHAQITIPPGTASGDSFMVTFHANPVI